MARTLVAPADLVPLIVTALNGVTVQGGVLTAVANGNEVKVKAHTDTSSPTYASQWSVIVH